MSKSMDTHHHMAEGHDMMNHQGNTAMPTDHVIGHQDHSGHSMGHSMDMMNMWFQFSTNATVLFEPWHFTTVGGLIGSMIGIFIMAALYEGLKYYREFLFWKTYNSLQYRAVSLPDKAPSVIEEPQVVQPSMLSKIHFYQTFLHMIQMILSYFLMLIFMTYNVWLCMAVVLGAGVGYFLFGWKKSVIVDVTEHCH
ncbi:high affinity copper uptake protein 1 isoform X2 [Euwallacea fornicatus]|uniref:high affinity copper uptake protein 1 isoform X2 n=1 Tax=Euwallacea fornicatus TaxID=995702 RepID=UPI00338FC008